MSVIYWCCMCFSFYLLYSALLQKRSWSQWDYLIKGWMNKKGNILWRMVFIPPTHTWQLTCMIPVNNFQWETCCLHLETVFTEDWESFVIWCNDNHLKLNINKTNELAVDYQRNRRPPVLFVIQGDKVKRADSYKYLGVQINKNFQDIIMSQWSWPLG